MKAAGFTGTQQGMTAEQRKVLEAWLGLYKVTEFHHGDCIGADAQAHMLALSKRLVVCIHPPKDDRKRAFVVDYQFAFPALPYLERNRKIVDETDCLIAAPRQLHEVLRSGTWSTVRYARKLGREVIVITPDGRIAGPPKPSNT